MGDERGLGGQLEQRAGKEAGADDARQRLEREPAEAQGGVGLSAGIDARQITVARESAGAGAHEEVQPQLVLVSTPFGIVEEVLGDPEQALGAYVITYRQLFLELAAQRVLRWLHDLDAPTGQRPEVFARVTLQQDVAIQQPDPSRAEMKSCGA